MADTLANYVSNKALNETIRSVLDGVHSAISVASSDSASTFKAEVTIAVSLLIDKFQNHAEESAALHSDLAMRVTELEKRNCSTGFETTPMNNTNCDSKRVTDLLAPENNSLLMSSQRLAAWMLMH